MDSSPITLWQSDKKKMETVTDLIFLGSKITADDNCSHEIKRHLLLGRKAMTKLNIILKSRDITLPTKVRLVKAMVFPVVMYGCDSWAIQMAEHQRIDAFWTVLEKTLGSPLDSEEIKPVNPNGNQSWIFIGRTADEADAPIFWPPDAKSLFTKRDPDAGKDWGQEDKGATEDEMVGCHHRLNGHEMSKLWEIVKDREAWCPVVHGVAKSWTRVSNWPPPTSHSVNFSLPKQR